MLVQSGNFDVKDDNLVLNTKDISNETKLFEHFDNEIGNIVDSKVMQICRDCLTDLVGAEASKKIDDSKIVAGFVKQIKIEFGVKTELRPDDLIIEVTEKRRREFEEKVVGHVYKELGITIVEDENGRPRLKKEGMAQNVSFLVNEIDHEDPRRGFEKYIYNAGKEARLFFGRLGYQNEANKELEVGKGRKL